MKFKFQSAFAGRVYSFVEKAATVFGFCSGLAVIWAFLFPGSAKLVLEDYQKRLAAAETQIARIEEGTQDVLDRTKHVQEQTGAIQKDTQAIREETARISAAIPLGISLRELFHSASCAENKIKHFETEAFFQNLTNTPVRRASIRAAAEDGTVLYRRDDVAISAGGDLGMILKSPILPDRICMRIHSETGPAQAKEYRVLQWRDSYNGCAETPEYSNKMVVAAVEEVPAAQIQLCRD